jgi:hypothetical protein
MEMFRNCGWPAFGALGVGILATLVGVVALALALMKPRVGIVVAVVAVAMSLGAPGVGVMGMYLGQQRVDDALSGPAVSPELKQRIREVGYDEARQCVPVGASIGVLPLIVAGIALAVGFARKNSATA